MSFGTAGSLLAAVLEGKTPTLEHLPRLTYTRSVIDETLRLYPPAWVFGRRAMKDDVICGVALPAQSVVLVSPWVSHHLPSLFPNPDVFEPERFLPEREKTLPRFAYFPFGGGPRQCIGNHFALMEMTLVLATLLQRARPEAIEPLPAVDASVTLRPANGLRVRMTPYFPVPQR